MPSTYSSKLRLELIATGEKSGTWGTATNTNLGTLLEQAIAGLASVVFPSDANVTLTTNNGSSDEARCAILSVTSSVSLTATRDVIVPTSSKLYIVYNNTTGAQSIRVKTSGGTGVTIPNGARMYVYCDGTNVVDSISNLPSGATVGGGAIYYVGGTDVGLADGGTGGSLSDPNADRIFFWDDSAGHVQWLAMGTGLAISGTDLSLSFLGLEALTDPGADRIAFWDDSETAFKWLAPGTGITISGTSLALSFLGLEALTDPGADSIAFWDDSAGAFAWLTPGTGLTISGTSMALSFLGLEALADPGADRLAFWDESENAFKWLAVNGFNVKIDATTLYVEETWVVAGSDETTTLTTGTNKATFVFPYDVTVVSVGASVNTASSSGAVTVDINESGATILSTKITIDQSEKTSLTAATPAVISDASIAAGNEVGIDIDGAGAGAKGLKVWMIVRRTS